MRKLYTIAFILTALNSFCQKLTDPGFESGQTKPWTMVTPATYGMSKEPGYEFSVRKDSVLDGKYSGRLENTGGKWCELFHKMPYTNTNAFQKFYVSVMMRTVGVVDGLANILVKVRDSEGKLLTYKNFPAGLSGTSDWKKLETEILVSSLAKTMEVGVSIQGRGTIWFDDFKLTEIKTGKISESPEMQAYLDSALDIIEKNALYRDSVDFKKLRQTAHIVAADAKLPKDCYAAIDYAIKKLNDKHSFYRTPEQAKISRNDDTTAVEMPSGKLINTDIAYIKVPAFHRINDKLEKEFAQRMQNLIRSLDSPAIKSWVIDVRGNTGGNGFPMIQGIGPILGDGDYNCSLDKNGRKTSCESYKDGTIHFPDGTTYMHIQSYQLIKQNPPVAILMNNMVGSSGEGLVLSFAHCDRTRTFGQPTFGLTTANEEFQLSDGAELFIASYAMTDRLGNRYGGKIYPDESIADDESTDADEILDSAVRWLSNQK